VRARQVRGPLGPGEPTATITILARRYQCRGCGAVVLVLPRGLVPRRHYAAAAIGLALWLVGVCGARILEVRRRVCAWSIASNARDWPALRRWMRAIDAGRLFPAIRGSPATFSLRQRTERAAMTLVALAPPGDASAEAAVMRGAARAR
jgi:DNA-directed RNA polymerase subunit RPC12/RpoP